jgi:cytosine/adenosine deaminase-related metal-dependent hydrolase
MNTIPSHTGRDPKVLDQLLSRPGASSDRILIRGGTVVTMDRELGDFAQGDILINGSVIEAVGPDLSEAATDGQAVVVDAAGTVVIPGLIDTHRHCWQTQFRRLLPDADLGLYWQLMHERLGPAYEPEDMYIGNLLAGLGAADSGVTCVLDFSHNSRSKAYSEEAIRAWKDVGLRAVIASCVPLSGDWDSSWSADLATLRSEHFSSDDQLLTLRMGVGAKVLPVVVGDLCLTPDSIRYARELGIGLHVDAVFGDLASAHILELEATGSLGPDITWIHCTALNDDAWSVIADTGGQVALAVTSDQQLGCQDALPPVQRAIDLGLTPGLSVDVECCLSTDMFTQMQVVLNTQRLMAQQDAYRGHEHAPSPMSTRDALEYATVGGAKANGVWDRCGSLTPGKQADLVLIDAGAINNLPLNNAVATVVFGADSRNVDTVFVAGQPRKWGGQLVGTDVAKLRSLVTASRDRLFERIGYELDVVG